MEAGTGQESQQPARLGAPLLESVAAIYSAAGGHLAADGRDHAGGHRGLHGNCRSRRCRRSTTRPSRCRRSTPARARTWWRPPSPRRWRSSSASAGPEPDDLDQLRRQLRDHAAVFAHLTSTSPSRKCRRPSTRRKVSAVQPARAAGLQQDQSRRRADSDAGHHVDTMPLSKGGRPGRHALAQKFRSSKASAW
jgi:hypothetical protein